MDTVIDLHRFKNKDSFRAAVQTMLSVDGFCVFAIDFEVSEIPRVGIQIFGCWGPLTGFHSLGKHADAGAPIGY